MADPDERRAAGQAAAKAGGRKISDPEAWPRIRGVISDLDGVVYRGDEPIGDAVEAFRAWARLGIRYVFVTNNSTRSAAEFSAKLNGMGVAAGEDQVVTTSAVTADHLRENWGPGTQVFVIGAAILRDSIEAAGFRVSEADPEVVVVGLDRDITYAKLRVAVRAVLAGAALVGTNPDLLLPASDGFEPGAGCLLTAIAAAARIASPIVVGKPQPLIIEKAFARLDTSRAETIVVGDQIATDITAGKQAGLCSVLVTTGVPETTSDAVEPDFVVDSLLEIPIRAE